MNKIENKHIDYIQKVYDGFYERIKKEKWYNGDVKEILVYETLGMIMVSVFVEIVSSYTDYILGVFTSIIVGVLSFIALLALMKKTIADIVPEETYKKRYRALDEALEENGLSSSNEGILIKAYQNRCDELVHKSDKNDGVLGLIVTSTVTFLASVLTISIKDEESFIFYKAVIAVVFITCAIALICIKIPDIKNETESNRYKRLIELLENRSIERGK